MSPTLIGIGGRLRAGKDVVAEHLEREHGFVRMGMSDVLHEALLAIDPLIVTSEGVGGIYEWCDYSQLVAEEGYVEAKKNPYVRAYLQRLGTEVGRNMIGEDTWVNIAGNRISDHMREGRSVVITGIRYPNELRMILSLGGRSVWIERPGLDSDASASSHASENSVQADDFRTVLVNDGTIGDLRTRTDALLGQIRGVLS